MKDKGLVSFFCFENFYVFVRQENWFMVFFCVLCVWCVFLSFFLIRFEYQSVLASWSEPGTGATV